MQCILDERVEIRKAVSAQQAYKRTSDSVQLKSAILFPYSIAMGCEAGFVCKVLYS